MAKKRFRKYYKKGRWSANIKQINYTDTSRLTDGMFYSAVTICTNPVQSDTTVSQQYTVKNIELALTVETNELNIIQYIENICGYIIYVPQGMTVTAEYPFQHPEYIMAYKYYGSPKPEFYSNGNDNMLSNNYPLKIKTRLSRRLQTGDGIIFLLCGRGEVNSNTDKNLQVNGLVRWWTKAN